MSAKRQQSNACGRASMMLVSSMHGVVTRGVCGELRDIGHEPFVISADRTGDLPWHAYVDNVRDDSCQLDFTGLYGTVLAELQRSMLQFAVCTNVPELCPVAMTSALTPTCGIITVHPKQIMHAVCIAVIFACQKFNIPVYALACQTGSQISNGAIQINSIAECIANGESYVDSNAGQGTLRIDGNYTEDLSNITSDDIRVIGNLQSTTSKIADCSGLNILRDVVYNLAKSQGKYDMQPNIAPLLMHCIGEVNEAHTAYMANNRAAKDDVEELCKLLDGNNVNVFRKYFKSSVKSTFEDEMADILLMILSIAGYYGVDLATHVKLKHAYNELRAEHSVANDYSK